MPRAATRKRTDRGGERRTASRGKQSRGAGTTRLPISGYDEKPLYLIRSEAFSLSPGQVNKLQSYEEENEGRDTLLRTFDHLVDGSESQNGGGRGRSAATRSRSQTSERGTTRGGTRAGSSKRTTDHDTIRQWAEDRGGQPVSVRGTGRGGTGVLRFDFEGYGAGKEELRPISWSEFFRKFDENNLELLYQDRTRDGRESRFFKFVSANGGQGRSKR